MAETRIEWADRVWNPITGCTPVSRGCDHCYARTFARRLQAMGMPGYENGFAVTLHPDKLDDPLHWRNPSRIFVDSMGDLFHPAVCGWRAVGKWEHWEPLLEIAHVIRCTLQHYYIILTKRPHIMADLWPRALLKLNAPRPLPNVALGVSVEDQASADERIPLLLQTPAALRVVSIEPMLGPVDLAHIQIGGLTINPLEGWQWPAGGKRTIGPRLGWVILGGETGPGARPMHPDWVRKVRDDCAAAGVPFFFKSWGEWRAAKDGPIRRREHLCRLGPMGEELTDLPGLWSDEDAIMDRVGKKRAGRMLDGRTHEAAPVLNAEPPEQREQADG